MRRLSVRTQLTLWFAGCLVAAVVAFGAGVYALFGSYMLGEVDRAIEEEILEVSEAVRTAPAKELQRRLDDEFGAHPFYRIEVTGPDGETVFRTPPGPPLALSGLPPKGYLRKTVPIPGSQPHRLIAERVERPEGPFTVVVADSLTSYRQTLGRLIVALAVLGPAAAALALLGGYWLSRRALSPVDRLTQAALSITGTGLDRRVPEDGIDDEVGRLAAAFNVMIGRLEAAFDEVRRFAADAAHELRTPLAVLRTGAEVALRSGGTAADYRRALSDQLGEIERLSRLADQLLFLCREDARHHADDAEEVRLDLLLEELCETLQHSAAARQLTLACDAAASCIVWAEPDRLRRLTLNLLDNALRYTPPGGRIDARLSLEAGQGCLTIENDGPGIDPKHLPHLFERFYRGDASRNRATGGSGLGLAICKSIVDSLGGQITLANRPQGGTMTTIRLPARTTPPAGRPGETTSTMAAARR